MPYPKFFVSHVAMDQDTDSNLFGHSCVFFLRQEHYDSKIEVIDAIGYYGIQPTSESEPFKKEFKEKLGLNIDFQGGHGIYQREPIRFIDRGVGLKGNTFQISQSKFYELMDVLKEIIRLQETAISDSTIRLDEALTLSIHEIKMSITKQKILIKQLNETLPPQIISYYGTLYSQLLKHIDLQERLLDNPRVKLNPDEINYFNSFTINIKKIIKQLKQQIQGVLNDASDNRIDSSLITSLKESINKLESFATVITPVVYKGERKYHAKHIYKTELSRAERLNESPRLSPFEFRFTVHDDYLFPVPSFRSATDCKTKAIDILIAAGVNQADINQLGRGHSKGNMPRLNGKTTPMPLHSLGKKQTHYSKRNKMTYFNSEWDRELGNYNRPYDVTLWMTIPPQNVMSTQTISEAEATSTRKQYDLPSNLLKKMTLSMAAIQRLERILIHSESFHDVTGKVALLLKLRHYAQHAFSHPHLNQDLAYVSKKLHEITHFLSAIHHAIQSSTVLTLETLNTHQSLSVDLSLSLNEKTKILKSLDFLAREEAPRQPCHIL